MKKDLMTPVKKKKLKEKKDIYIAAIETSCDETAFSIVKNGREVISNVVASQIPIHKKYGGVVPEVAAREHLNVISKVIREGFETANIMPEKIDAIASTVGPGLVGSLLVGLNAAKGLCVAYDKPFIGVNHLFAHICANYIETELEPPFISLLISGGHTQIIKVTSFDKQEILGETIDDATGEVYDKVARLLGVSYPGGPNLDKMAQLGDKNAYCFTEAKVSEFDFSFSGLKTAVLNLVKKLENQYRPEKMPKNDIAASFQENITKILFKKTLNAAKKYNLNKIVLAGGVAANSEIRKKFFALEKEGFEIFAPKMKYCTDNAAMVASCAYFMNDTVSDLNVEAFSRV